MGTINCCCLLMLLMCGGLCLGQPASIYRSRRIAEEKCQQYIDANTDSAIGGTLSMDPELTVYHQANCSTSVDLIVNGVEAEVGEFPHQALLGYRNKTTLEVKFKCGGSLISEWFVLTAAHCETPSFILLGEHDLGVTSGKERNYMIATHEGIIRHPDYKPGRSYHDIALVQLSSKVEFNEWIRPACLWTSDPFNMSSVVATGFGVTEPGVSSKQSSVLMKVVLDMMNRTTCEDKYNGDYQFPDGIEEHQLCIGNEDEGKDTCYGDSGGPIQVATDLTTCAYYIVGVTSYGGACGTGASVYTKVTSHLDWIVDNVWPEEEDNWYDWSIFK